MVMKEGAGGEPGMVNKFHAKINFHENQTDTFSTMAVDEVR
jgi:hypothetical protein